MKLKFGTLMLSALAVSAMSAQTPTAIQDIYSQTGNAALKTGEIAVYSFGNWHAGSMNGDIAAWSPLFEEMLAVGVATSVNAIAAEANGISISWSSVDRQVTVKCDSDKLGRASVLIAAMDGAARGVVDVDESPAVISLADYLPGVYAVAVAVDGKLIKTLKINLK